MKLLLFVTIVFLTVFSSCTNNESPVIDWGDDFKDTGETPDTAPVLLNPGRACTCNDQCKGSDEHAGLCLMGICVQKAAHPCDTAAACPAGMHCRQIPGIDVFPVCFAQYIENECGGYPSSYNFCEPHLPATCGTCDALCTPFACTGAEEDQPGTTFETAITISPDAPLSQLFERCAGRDYWFKITAAPGNMTVFGAAFYSFMGNLDLLVYDAAGQVIAWRKYGETPWPAEGTVETDEEFYSIIAKETPETVYLRITAGEPTVENRFLLTVNHTPFRDGKTCENEGFTVEECKTLLPFPLPLGNSSFDNYMFDADANYRFGMRRLIMMLRYAISRVTEAFPDTNRLGLNDFSQIDGKSPAYDGKSMRHRMQDHESGFAVDIAYYQKNGDNHFRIVCPASHFSCECDETTQPEQLLIDPERQAFFMAQLLETGGVDGVMLSDKMIIPVITNAITKLCSYSVNNPQRIAPEICRILPETISNLRCHHHHIHIGTPNYE